MILLIDNYDSFVHNLARYFRRQDCDTEVVRNDQLSIHDIESMAPAAIIISPGPGTPADAGCSTQVVKAFAERVPILGICLGHQVIVEAFGGKVIRSGQPMHGRSSDIAHDGSSMFDGIPSPFPAGRYHSLIADKKTLPPCLKITAWSNDYMIMAIEHQTFPVYGLQFHPESILTDVGANLIQNFLKLATSEPVT